MKTEELKDAIEILELARRKLDSVLSSNLPVEDVDMDTVNTMSALADIIDWLKSKYNKILIQRQRI